METLESKRYKEIKRNLAGKCRKIVLYIVNHNIIFMSVDRQNILNTQNLTFNSLCLDFSLSRPAPNTSEYLCKSIEVLMCYCRSPCSKRLIYFKSKQNHREKFLRTQYKVVHYQRLMRNVVTEGKKNETKEVLEETAMESSKKQTDPFLLQSANSQ